MSFKDISPLWELAETFTVDEAAALIVGFDPESVDASGNFFMDRETGITDSDGIVEVQKMTTILTRSIDAGSLIATKRYTSWERGWDEELDEGQIWADENPMSANAEERAHFTRRSWIRYIDWNQGKTTIDRPHLVAWLQKRGFTSGFFFPTALPPVTHEPDYLNPDHSRYAPKLAAAVRAWQAVTDPGPKTPKQALAKWLLDHAMEFDLLKADGTPADLAIEETAKTANWNPKGGPASTPGG